MAQYLTTHYNWKLRIILSYSFSYQQYSRSDDSKTLLFCIVSRNSRPILRVDRMVFLLYCSRNVNCGCLQCISICSWNVLILAACLLTGPKRLIYSRVLKGRSFCSFWLQTCSILTCVMCKLMEYVIKDYLMWYLLASELTSKHQHMRLLLNTLYD